jgi:hypothetical protein
MDEIVLSKHAEEQIEARGISESDVWAVIRSPQQTLTEETESDKVILQSILKDEVGNEYLIRVFVNVVKNPKLVITVYRTSKINKYWQNES